MLFTLTTYQLENAKHCKLENSPYYDIFREKKKKKPSLSTRRLVQRIIKYRAVTFFFGYTVQVKMNNARFSKHDIKHCDEYNIIYILYFPRSDKKYSHRKIIYYFSILKFVSFSLTTRTTRLRYDMYQVIGQHVNLYIIFYFVWFPPTLPARIKKY